jgi:hypothetical protein
MNQVPVPDHQPVNKIHMWMLILLAWTAVFSLIGVGLLLTKGSTSISSSDISLACQNGTLNGITTNLTRISDVCKASDTDAATSTAPTGNTFDAAGAEGTLPALTLPLNWTASWSTGPFGEGVLAEFHAVKGIYETCEACGGMPNPPEFRVTSLLVAKAELMDPEKIKADFVEKSKAADAEYTNIVVTSSTVAGGTLVSIDGTADIQAAGATNGPFHILRYINATKYVELNFTEWGGTNAEWMIVKNSLDWSTVK